jgi:DNA-directed RNA polymerase specialized sigma24 family protein
MTRVSERTTTPTDLLLAWGRGETAALDQLVPLVHDELRRMARRYMGRERPDHTLQATALVNEVYLRLTRSTRCAGRTARSSSP